MPNNNGAFGPLLKTSKMRKLIKILSSKTTAYIFTALALAYFLGHIFTALASSGHTLTAGLLGAASILLFSILYTNLKK
jgi:hypothetical protein